MFQPNFQLKTLTEKKIGPNKQEEEDNNHQSERKIK